MDDEPPSSGDSIGAKKRFFMANRRFTQFFYTAHAMPTLIDFNFVVGATGAVGTLKGPGVQSVTRLSAGTYKVKLQDNYTRFYGAYLSQIAPVTGSDVTAGSFVSGTTYQITALGNTNWNAIGLSSELTAAVGMSFVATGVGSGTGTAKAVSSSGIVAAEIVGNPDLTLGPVTASGRNGGVVIFQCVDDSGAVADPAETSIISMALYLSNSSVKVQGE